jgi:uncharacterized protein YlbG (UPF0298 family)
MRFFSAAFIFIYASQCKANRKLKRAGEFIYFPDAKSANRIFASKEKVISPVERLNKAKTNNSLFNSGFADGRSQNIIN